MASPSDAPAGTAAENSFLLTSVDKDVNAAPRRLYCNKVSAVIVAKAVSHFTGGKIRLEHQGTTLIGEYVAGHPVIEKIDDEPHRPVRTEEVREEQLQRETIDEEAARARAAHRIDTAEPLTPRARPRSSEPMGGETATPMRPVVCTYNTTDPEAWKGTLPAHGTRRALIRDVVLDFYVKANPDSADIKGEIAPLCLTIADDIEEALQGMEEEFGAEVKAAAASIIRLEGIAEERWKRIGELEDDLLLKGQAIERQDRELEKFTESNAQLQREVEAQRIMYAAFVEKMHRPQLIAPEGPVPAGTRELRVVLDLARIGSDSPLFVELEDQDGCSVGGFKLVNDDPTYPGSLSYLRIPYGRSDEWVRDLINEVTMRCIGGIDSAGIDRTLREYGVEVKHPADVDDAAAAPVGGPMSDALEKAVKDDEGPGEPEPGEGPDPDDEDRETVGSFHVIVGPDEEPYVAIESICDVLDDVGANAVERDRRLRDRGMRVHFDEEPEGLLQRALRHLGVR